MKSLQEQLEEVKKSFKKASDADNIVKTSTSKEFKVCAVCSCKLLAKNHNKHMQKVHPPEKIDKVKAENDRWLYCELCKKNVKYKHFIKHMSKVHGKLLSKDKYKRGSLFGKKSKSPIVNTQATPKKIHKSISLGSRQTLLAKINQGRYDTEIELIRLLHNTNNLGDQDIIKAIQQRLKVISPKIYRKLVGPLILRDPMGSKSCYCAIPKSYQEISNDIINSAVPFASLLCDACWKEDICATWGYFGAYSEGTISLEVWRALCEARGESKFSIF